MKKSVFGERLKTVVKAFKAEYRKSVIVSWGVFATLAVLVFMVVGNSLKRAVAERQADVQMIRSEIDYRRSLLTRENLIEEDGTRFRDTWNFLLTKVFREESQEQAFFRMQQILEGIFKTRNLEIRSFRFGEARMLGEFVVLPVGLEFSASYEDAVSVMSALETSDEYLIIKDMEIISLHEKRQLTIRMNVEGIQYHEESPQ